MGNTGLEAHRSNGRIERVIRTLREAIIKQEVGNLEERIGNAVKGYNNMMHGAIKCTPLEAWEEDSGLVVIENNELGDYATKFKKRYRESFKENQIVRIAKRDNLGVKTKTEKGRFTQVGKVLYKCENDSYVVKTEDGRLLNTLNAAGF